MALSSIAKTYKISPMAFEKQYKYHLSDYLEWDQKEHAENYIVFPDNIGENLSIDETSVSNGELYTILTNKQRHGRKGALVAMVKGTKSADIIKVLSKIPKESCEKVKEVTLDMSNSMNVIISTCFPQATIVIDRFHVAQLVTGAVQDVRIDIRKQAIKDENVAHKKAKEEKKYIILKLMRMEIQKNNY